MAAGSRWGITPRQSIERECRDRGTSTVVAACIDLLNGREVEPTMILSLGGPPARWVVDGGKGGPEYWLRVWAARGLLWAWDDAAVPSIETALRDPAWRVREMAAKVAARHELGDVLQLLEQLRADPNRRVRVAAERAVIRITTARA